MNKLDYIFLGLIGASVLYSLIRGLVREIFSLAAILLGFLGASHGYRIVASWLHRWIENESIGNVFGFLIIFVSISLATSLLGRVLSRLVRKTPLRWADRLGGAAFGLFKAVLLIAMIFLALAAFLPPKNQLLSESKISPHAVAVARGLSFLAPPKLHALYAEKEAELKKNWALQELPREKVVPRGGKK